MMIKAEQPFYLKFSFFVFVIASLIGVFFHEPWRDEIEAFMIARDAGSFGELYQNMRYQGHPMLWHLGLFVITRFSVDPIYMQFYHWIIISIAVWIFIFKSPFPAWFRGLFPFGYYLFFEYNVISRNYGITVLLFFLFALYFYRKPWLAALFLGLSMHTNSYALVCGAGLAGGLWGWPLVYALFKERKWSWQPFLLLTFTALIGFISLYFMIPPDDAVYKPRQLEWGDLKEFLEHTGSIFWSLPAVHRFWLYKFWNARLFYDTNIITIYSILILGYILIYLLKKPEHRLAFVLATIFIVFFNHLVYPNSAFRHWGMWSFSFFTLIWIRGFQHVSFQQWMPEKLFWVGLLSVNILAGISARIYDTLYPFSSGKQVAELIKQNKWEDKLIIGYPDYSASTTLGFLPGKKLYYPERKKYATFMVWDMNKHAYPNCPEMEILCLEEMKKSGHKEAIFLTAYPISCTWKRVRAQEMFYSGRTISYEEDLHVYKLNMNE